MSAMMPVSPRTQALALPDPEQPPAYDSVVWWRRFGESYDGADLPQNQWLSIEQRILKTRQRVTLGRNAHGGAQLAEVKAGLQGAPPEERWLERYRDGQLDDVIAAARADRPRTNDRSGPGWQEVDRWLSAVSRLETALRDRIRERDQTRLLKCRMMALRTEIIFCAPDLPHSWFPDSHPGAVLQTPTGTMRHYKASDLRELLEAFVGASTSRDVSYHGPRGSNRVSLALGSVNGLISVHSCEIVQIGEEPVNPGVLFRRYVPAPDGLSATPNHALIAGRTTRSTEIGSSSVQISRILQVHRSQRPETPDGRPWQALGDTFTVDFSDNADEHQVVFMREPQDEDTAVEWVLDSSARTMFSRTVSYRYEEAAWATQYDAHQGPRPVTFLAEGEVDSGDDFEAILEAARTGSPILVNGEPVIEIWGREEAVSGDGRWARWAFTAVFALREDEVLRYAVNFDENGGIADAIPMTSQTVTQPFEITSYDGVPQEHEMSDCNQMWGFLTDACRNPGGQTQLLPHY